VVGRYYAYTQFNKTSLIQVTDMGELDVAMGSFKYKAWPSPLKGEEVYSQAYDIDTRRYFTPLWYEQFSLMEAQTVSENETADGEWLPIGPGAIYVEMKTNNIFFIGPQTKRDVYCGSSLQVLADWPVHKHLGTSCATWQYETKLIREGEPRYVTYAQY